MGFVEQVDVCDDTWLKNPIIKVAGRKLPEALNRNGLPR